MTKEGEQLLTVDEAAVYLNTPVRFVRRLVSERLVTFHHVGRHVRFAVADLRAFVLAGRVEAIDVHAIRRGGREVA